MSVLRKYSVQSSYFSESIAPVRLEGICGRRDFLSSAISRFHFC